MLLSTLTAALLSATVTNTETVHDLAAYNGHVVACTEGGLELFTRAGRAVRTLPRLADPRVYALLVEEGTVLFGTEGGLSQLDWSAPAAVTRR